MEHEEIIRSLAERLYDQKVMDNRERGDYAEQLVDSKVCPPWKWVGMGWHPWDFERGEGADRVRMQVRQSAAKQIWKRPANHVAGFPTTIKPVSSYIRKNNPELLIEDQGRFCEMYVFAWHGRDGEDVTIAFPTNGYSTCCRKDHWGLASPYALASCRARGSRATADWLRCGSSFATRWRRSLRLSGGEIIDVPSAASEGELGFARQVLASTLIPW